MQRIAGKIKGTAFFPGGRGTTDGSETISNKPIMVLGQDFDTVEKFNKDVEADEEDMEKNATWNNLRKLLKECDFKLNDCFFTNVILGARNNSKATGKSPAFKDKEFISYCRKFFLKQLETQKPKLILVLGKEVAMFLGQYGGKLEVWKKIINFQSVDEAGNQIIRDATFPNGITTNLVLLVHPSYRPVNVKRRRFNGLDGIDAEVEMIKTMRNEE